MQKITPFLWFDTQAEEAAQFYVATFGEGKILKTTRYPEATKVIPNAPKPGSVQTVEFELRGMKFVALNGGKIPGFEFSPAISFQVDCETQEEVNRLWEKLSADPKDEQCGWCKDQFGVTWQIVPSILGKMMSDPDQNKVEAVTAAFLPMKKLIIKDIQDAYDKA